MPINLLDENKSVQQMSGHNNNTSKYTFILYYSQQVDQKQINVETIRYSSETGNEMKPMFIFTLSEFPSASQHLGSSFTIQVYRYFYVICLRYLIANDTVIKRNL